MLSPLKSTTLRKLERCLLWFTVPALVLSALVAATLAVGGANIHGGTGYTLLLLVPLVPAGLLVTVILLPVLMLQYRLSRDELAYPLAKPAMAIGILYLAFCVWVAWQLAPQITASR